MLLDGIELVLMNNERIQRTQTDGSPVLRCTFHHHVHAKNKDYHAFLGILSSGFTHKSGILRKYFLIFQ
jgi:hypothetical protein